MKIGGGRGVSLLDRERSGTVAGIRNDDPIAGAIETGLDFDPQPVDGADRVADGIDPRLGQIDRPRVAVRIGDGKGPLGDAPAAVEALKRVLEETTLRCMSPLLTELTAPLTAMPSLVAVSVLSALATIRLPVVLPVVSSISIPSSGLIDRGGNADAGVVDGIDDILERLVLGQIDGGVVPARLVMLREPRVPNPWPPLRLDNSTLLSPPSKVAAGDRAVDGACH